MFSRRDFGRLAWAALPLAATANASLGRDMSSIPLGQGETPTKQVLLLLKTHQWKIPANIEYEYKGADTVTEVKKCYQFMKDAVA